MDGSFCSLAAFFILPIWISIPLLFTSLAVLFSTIFYTWKHKAVSVEETVLTSDSEGNSSHEREKIAATQLLINDSMIELEAKERKEEQASDDGVDNDSDCACQDSQDSDLDGSISDEDSLIEIALPSGHFVDQQKEECKYNNCSLQQNKRELLLSADQSLFNQQSLMEILAEFNEMYEEENLIEIDISMGTSIKCSRFEIEA